MSRAVPFAFEGTVFCPLVRYASFWGNDGGPDTSPEEGGVSYLHMPFEADSIVNGPAPLAGP